MKTAGCLALAAALWSTAAWAQTEWVTEDRPVSVQGMGGVEGYTGVLASKLDRSGTWGVTVGFDPFRFLGAEAGYSGALNYIRGVTVVGGTAQIARNGGYLAATPGLRLHLDAAETMSLKTYLLAGAGFDSYQATVLINQYSNLSAATLVGGAGLRFQWNHFVLDLRASYVWDWGESFTLYDPNPGRWVVQMGVGGAIF